jgi:hypothetical protein
VMGEPCVSASLSFKARDSTFKDSWVIPRIARNLDGVFKRLPTLVFERSWKVDVKKHNLS